MPRKKTFPNGNSTRNKPKAQPAKESDSPVANNPPEEITLSGGRKITVCGVAPWTFDSILQSLAAKAPKPPTYAVALPGGEEEIHPHDVKSVKQMGGEAIPAWDGYQRALRAWESERKLLYTEMVFEYGLELVGLPADDFWLKRQQRFGMTVPDEPYERLLHYRRTEVLKTPWDIFLAMDKMLELSGVPEEARLVAGKSFRRAMGRLGRDAAVRATEGAGELVGEPEVPGDAGSAPLGESAE